MPFWLSFPLDLPSSVLLYELEDVLAGFEVEGSGSVSAQILSENPSILEEIDKAVSEYKRGNIIGMKGFLAKNNGLMGSFQP